MPADLPLRHAPDELSPRGVAFGTELNACLSGIVQTFVVEDVATDVPSGVVGVAVEGRGGHGGRFVHESKIL